MANEEATDLRLRQVLVIAEAIFRRVPEEDRFALLEFIHSQKFVSVEEPELLSEAERADQGRQLLATDLAFDFLALINDRVILGDAPVVPHDDSGADF